MNLHEYDDMAAALLADAHEIAASKRPAYTLGDPDVLANFKSIAARIGITPGQVLSVYMLKHIDAITAVLSRPDLPQAESFPSRCADALNYIALGYALVAERDTHVPLPAWSADPTGTCDSPSDAT